MRFWMGMMMGCCALVGYAQEATAPEEVVIAEETTTDSQEVAPADAHKEGEKPAGGCGCGKGKPK